MFNLMFVGANKNKPNALKRMQALLHRADYAVLAPGVAFVLLKIRHCGVGFACASRLTFHPVECKTGNFKHPLQLNITRSNCFLVGQKNRAET